MSVRVRWAGRTVHTSSPTSCGKADESKFRSEVPLWMFNLLWWEGVVCRTCVPSPVLSKRHADKVPWPWRGVEA